MKMDSSKSANISNTIHIMKVAMQSPMCVHDVLGESAIYYPHHEAALLSTFVKKMVWLLRHHKCGMLNLECA
jgi:hypothetical protein